MDSKEREIYYTVYDLCLPLFSQKIKIRYTRFNQKTHSRYEKKLATCITWPPLKKNYLNVLENTVSNWRTMKSLTQQLARSKREEEKEEEDFAHFSQTERFEKETRRKRRRRGRSTPCEAAVNTRPWTVFIESFCILDSRTSWFIIITEISRFHSSTVLHGWENSWMDRKK